MDMEAGVAVVLFSGGFDRVHYALALLAAAAATGRPVATLVAGQALPALLAGEDADHPGWHALAPADDGASPRTRNQTFAERGIATIEELLSACAALDVPVIACEMGLRALGLAPPHRFRPDLTIAVGGIVGFLAQAGSSRIVFI